MLCTNLLHIICIIFRAFLYFFAPIVVHNSNPLLFCLHYRVKLSSPKASHSSFSPSILIFLMILSLASLFYSQNKSYRCHLPIEWCTRMQSSCLQHFLHLKYLYCLDHLKIYRDCLQLFMWALLYWNLQGHSRVLDFQDFVCLLPTNLFTFSMFFSF